MITEGSKKQKLKVGIVLNQFQVYVNFRKRTTGTASHRVIPRRKNISDVARTVRMSPNTMKAMLSRAGLYQCSTESRPYELFSEGLVDNSW